METLKMPGARLEQKINAKITAAEKKLADNKKMIELIKTDPQAALKQIERQLECRIADNEANLTKLKNEQSALSEKQIFDAIFKSIK